jgi:hypothetical protein
MLIQSMLFSGIVHSDQLSLPTGDLVAPQVQHDPISEPLNSESILRIKATVTDNVGVNTVLLFYRHAGDSQYQRKPMLREAKGSDLFSVTLGHKDLAAPGIEYYIQATDTSGNSVLYGYSFEPIKLSVVSDSGFTADVLDGNSQPANDTSKAQKEHGSKWMWIALGVLAVGAVAASAGGGDGGGGGGGDSGTVTVSGPLPQ